MDHFFQIHIWGERDEPMLESYAALSFVAGATRRLQLGALVTGVSYRHPGVLVKQVTTLDVLSGGRAWLGIGAAWNEDEARSLGIPFPPLAERFEQLDETLQIAAHMWRGDRSPFKGKRFELAEPICEPGPVRTPHPPVLIGGSGERRTLRLVAERADACNLFEFLGADEVQRKLDVLRRHCEAVGRPYDDIIKTTTGEIPVGASADQLADHYGRLAEFGIDMAIVELPLSLDMDAVAAAVTAAAPTGRAIPAAMQPVVAAM